MSGIIMHAGLTACIVVPELCRMIPWLWQSPFHFTDEIRPWWSSSDDVILTPTKRGLSQPLEAFGGVGWLQLQRVGVSKWEGDFWEGLSVGKFEWMDQIYSELKKCWGREMMQRASERACLLKPCLAYWLPVRLRISTAHICSNGAAQWLTIKLCVILWNSQMRCV